MILTTLDVPKMTRWPFHWLFKLGFFKFIFLVKWILNSSSEKLMQIFNLLFDLGSTIMSDNQIAHSTSSMNSINSQEFVQVLFDHNNIIAVHLIYILLNKGYYSIQFNFMFNNVGSYFPKFNIILSKNSL